MSRIEPNDEIMAEARTRLARRMRALRTATSMSQAVASARAGMTRRNWSRIETGELNPRLDSLLRIQYALRVDGLDALFGPTTGDLFGRDPENT
jgi:transcriptional regulator with XRE-family HTH domain